MEHLMKELESTAPQTAVQEESPVLAQAAQEAGEAAADVETRMRAQALLTQAQTIQAVTGMNVMAVYETDMEVRTRVLNGTWDFVDVWKQMGGRKPQPPVPVRTANGSVGGGVNISAMSDRQFEKLNEILKRGGTIPMND